MKTFSFLITLLTSVVFWSEQHIGTGVLISSIFWLEQHIGTGALALTTNPKNADIYINGILKSNMTPLVVKLPEGKHQLEIKKEGKQSVSLEVFITQGVVLSKKITLIDNPPLPLPIPIPDMLYPSRDVFETQAEFQKRRQQLVKDFNQAVQQQDSPYQAGIAYLDKSGYDIETGTFPVRLEWQASWIKSFNLPKKGCITTERDDAKQLWQAGEQKPLYVHIELSGKTVRVSQPILYGLEKKWQIDINKHLPTELLNTWQEENKQTITAAAFSPDINIFASGREKKIQLWETKSGKLLHHLEGHDSEIASLAFSADGKMLASGSMDKKIKLWEVSTGKLFNTLSKGILFFSEGHENAVNSLAFSPQGQFLVSGGSKTVKVWEVSTGKLLHTLSGHQDEIKAVAITQRDDGILIIASGSQDKTIKLWFNTVPVYTLTGQCAIQSLAFSPDRKFLASSSCNNTIKLWRIKAPNAPPRTLQGGGNSMAFSPDSRILASIYESKIQLWEVNSGYLLYSLDKGLEKEKAIAFSSDGHRLALASELNTIKLWKAAMGLPQQ